MLTLLTMRTSGTARRHLDMLECEALVMCLFCEQLNNLTVPEGHTGLICIGQVGYVVL